MVFIDLLNNCAKNNNKWATCVVAQQKVGNLLLPSVHPWEVGRRQAAYRCPRQSSDQPLFGGLGS